MRLLVILLPLLTLQLTACMSRPDNGTSSDPNTKSDETTVLYQFGADSANDWDVEDDTVMGGRSEGHFEVNANNNGHFHGDVSLENNGGFSSIQYDMDEPLSLTGKTAFKVRVQGDGKNYNFRVQRPGQRHSYTFEFPTQAGKWETIAIPFDAMKPTFRGETPDVPNYAGGEIKQLRFLIGNKKEQQFSLLLDTVEVI